ncbi:glutathione synthetase [Streptomyces sp. MNP-20]|uniref:glutathione synthetase n=1 Tax=Streptomyces sp. MNP-20 TaxID=2721165 RepID=UPI00155754C1|nr:glutathione synthetase [Streptomyces sp. MNP-20]
MAFTLPASDAHTPPLHAPALAAVVAPAADDPYVSALARHGWNCVAITTPDPPPAAAEGYFQHVPHRGSLHHTAARLSRLGVRAVIPGSPAGTELADRLAHRLGLPGNDPTTTDLRRDTGWSSAALRDAGITAPLSIRTSRLAEALTWAAATDVTDYVLEHPDPARPARTHPCATADDIRSAWHTLQPPAGHPLVLREHLRAPHYRVHTLTRPRANGYLAHTVTAIWAEAHTPDHRLHRADLLSHHGLLANALTLYTRRALTVLGVRYGPAQVTLAFLPDRGPVLLALRTDPDADFAADALHRATGHSPVHDTALLLTTGRHASPPRHTHATKLALLPRHDGPLGAPLLDTIASLPTVAATTELHADTPGRAGQIAGWLLLMADHPRAISEDLWTIRAAEYTGLYGRPA